MTRLAALCSLPLVACLQLGQQTGSGTGSPGGAASDGGAPATTDASASAAGCGTDPTTGVTLCLQSSACSSFSVDPSAFPSCGFRQGGSSAFDLECLCNGTILCPIGAPTSCDSAKQLLTQEQSALQVCQQVSSSGCLQLDAGGGSSSGGSGGGLSSACQTCVAGCGGTPSCYESCGC